MGGITFNMPIWFLLSLAVVRIVYLLANKINATIPLILISVIIAYLLSRYEINEPCYLGNIALGLFFFGMGYMLRGFQFNKWLVIIAAVIYVICYENHDVIVGLQKRQFANNATYTIDSSLNLRDENDNRYTSNQFDSDNEYTFVMDVNKDDVVWIKTYDADSDTAFTGAVTNGIELVSD